MDIRVGKWNMVVKIEMHEKKIMTKLPIIYKKYFWDCDFNRLDLNTHKEFIVKRLLNYGNLSAIKYILSEIPQKYVGDLLIRNGENILSRTNYLFWQKIVRHNELWG